MTTDLTTQTPVEIDTALASVYADLYKVEDKMKALSNHIEEMKVGISKHEAGDLRYSSYTRYSLALLVAQHDDLSGLHAFYRSQAHPFQAEFNRRGGWTRFFLVANNGGHIHSSMDCSTCFPTTRFGWLPQHSGKTEAEAVAEHGAILCTVCYPTAPTEWTNGVKPGDEDICSGSGQYYDQSQPSRTGYYSGNWGTCKGCGERQTITKAMKIRKHKK